MQDVDAVDVSGAELSLVDIDDQELLTWARRGHQEAYAELFSRYSYAALRLARHLGQKEDADDVVSESFAQVLDLLQRGKGPDRAFRAYLFTTVRHECGRRAKARRRVLPTDDERQIDSVVPFGDGRLDDFERSAIRAAYESLPPRWRTVLWHLDVEGRKPHELGPLMDLSANSVSALVYRARSGLREAYLQEHVGDDEAVGDRRCREVRSKLSAFVRRTASSRVQEKIHTHLESCEPCMAVYLDLQEVNREVGSAASPRALVASATGLTAVGALASALSQAVALAKGAVLAVGPPTAAAALTTATLVGVVGTGMTSLVAEGAATPIVLDPLAPAQRDAGLPGRREQPDRATQLARPAPAPDAEPVVSGSAPPVVASPPTPSGTPDAPALASTPAPEPSPTASPAPPKGDEPKADPGLDTLGTSVNGDTAPAVVSGVVSAVPTLVAGVGGASVAGQSP